MHWPRASARQADRARCCCLSLGIGVVGGWVTVLTGGIGAILVAHAVTRFAIFIATGHAGQVTPSAAFDEEVAEQDSKVTPSGWEVVENQGR